MISKPIGIIDSGVGGLSIWHEIVKQLPNESTIYIADSQNCPYGAKEKDEIYTLAKRLIQFVIKKRVKIIIIACNTITVSSIDKLRSTFPTMPIVGMVPVVKTASEKTKKKIIGILSTYTTANSDYQNKLIETFAMDCEVINIGTDTLVPFVERGEVDSKKLTKVLMKELGPFIQNNIDTLALGCSHFLFLKKAMQEVLGENTRILESSGAIARQVGRVLTANGALSPESKAVHQFYTTGNVGIFKKVIRKLLGDTIGNVKHAEL